MDDADPKLLNGLPDDLLCHVLSFVSVRDKQRVAQRVCLKWRRLLQTWPNPQIWNHVRVNFRPEITSSAAILALVQWVIARSKGISVLELSNLKNGTNACTQPTLLAALGALRDSGVAISIVDDNFSFCRKAWCSVSLAAAAEKVTAIDATCPNFRPSRGDMHRLCGLRSLQQLGVTLRNTTGDIQPPPLPADAFQLSSLRSLRLMYCNIGVAPLLPAATLLPHLTLLQIERCSIAEVPAAVAHMSQLRCLSITMNRELLSLPLLARLTALSVLDLSGNSQVTDLRPALLGACVQTLLVKHVHDYGGPPCDAAFVEALAGLKSLRHLDISGRQHSDRATHWYYLGQVAAMLHGKGATLEAKS